MLKDEPSGLSYVKILNNFKREHPTQCRKVFIRRALDKKPFKQSRNRFILSKKAAKKRVKKSTKKPVSASVPTPVATVSATPPSVFVRGISGSKAPVFDNSTVVAPVVPAAPNDPVPHWHYEHDGWKKYDKAASDVVEAAYQTWKANPYTDVRAIKSGEWQYMVDFNKMEQQNIQHENHTTRKIRRDLIVV